MIIKYKREIEDFMVQNNLNHKKVMVLRSSTSETYEIGIKTNGTYSDGTKIHTGDVIISKTEDELSNPCLVLRDKGKFRIMGFYGSGFPTNGVFGCQFIKRKIISYVKYHNNYNDAGALKLGLDIDLYCFNILKRSNLRITEGDMYSRL